MPHEVINCYICGTTHGFGARCPTPEQRGESLMALRQENARLRAVLYWQVYPYVRGQSSAAGAAVRRVIEQALGLSQEDLA